MKYEPGELKVVAYKNGKQLAEDTVKTTGEAANISMSADRAQINADSSDLSFITVKITNKMVCRFHVQKTSSNLKLAARAKSWRRTTATRPTWNRFKINSR